MVRPRFQNSDCFVQLKVLGANGKVNLSALVSALRPALGEVPHTPEKLFSSLKRHFPGCPALSLGAVPERPSHPLTVSWSDATLQRHRPVSIRPQQAFAGLRPPLRHPMSAHSGRGQFPLLLLPGAVRAEAA